MNTALLLILFIIAVFLLIIVLLVFFAQRTITNYKVIQDKDTIDPTFNVVYRYTQSSNKTVSINTNKVNSDNIGGVIRVVNNGSGTLNIEGVQIVGGNGSVPPNTVATFIYIEKDLLVRYD